jgi:hypothetical protein
MRRPLFSVPLLILLLLVGCGDAHDPGASRNRSAFEEGNDTPHALAATLFEVLRTGDRVLWDPYVATVEELSVHKESTSRHQASDSDLRRTVKKIRGNFMDLHNELRCVNGVHGAPRIRFLRAYTQYCSPDDSVQSRSAVEYTFRDHYIGSVLFREMIKTDRRWVLAERSLYRDDVASLVPLGGPRR